MKIMSRFIGNNQYFREQILNFTHLPVNQPLTLEIFERFITTVTATLAAYQDCTNYFCHPILNS